ncbi:MAG: TetR/AcrR family transcriptional regulator [Caulobacterales bacterium]
MALCGTAHGRNPSDVCNSTYKQLRELHFGEHVRFEAFTLTRAPPLGTRSMNQMPLRTLAAVAQLRRPTQRALAKQRTRERILASAKALFTERGYERATVRDIAAAAGMSTGAVFASFSDKSDLFNEIVAADRDALHEAMHNAATGQTARASILAMFAAAAALHLADLPLTQAVRGALWSPELGPQVRGRLRRRPITELIEGVLRAGAATGEIPRGTDLGLLARMLWDVYMSNLRHAAFDGSGAEAMQRRLTEQTAIIFAGIGAD